MTFRLQCEARKEDFHETFTQLYGSTLKGTTHELIIQTSIINKNLDKRVNGNQKVIPLTES